jgi:hypothetical protein
MNELVQRLATGKHSVTAARYGSAKALRDCVDRKFVLVKFTETQGGTEIGYPLDMDKTRCEGADFEAGKGVVTLVGNLSLNYENVRCVAEIDLSSLTGTGHLEVLDAATPGA